MSVDLWISVALAIPLAVLANLFTPKIQAWLERRASKGKTRKAEEEKRNREKQLASLESEFSEIESLVQSPSVLMNQNFVALLKIALYGAFGSLYGGLFVLLGKFTGWNGLLGPLHMAPVLQLLAQITALMVAMLIFLTAAKAIRTNRRVNEFEEYKQRTQKLIAELKNNS